MKSIIKTLAIALLLIATQLQAAVMLGGKGLSHEYNVTPGQQLSGTLELRNGGNQPAEVKIYQEDLQQGNARSNKSWVRLSSNRIILPPGAKQNVAYTISVPAGAGNGTYWSAIMLEPVSNKSRESEMNKAPVEKDKFVMHIETVTRYAVTVMTHIGSGASNLSFSAPKIETDETGQKVFGITVQNGGNRHSRPDISLEVFNAQGNPMKTLKGESQSIFPGTSKRLTIPLTGLAPGQYKALLAADDRNTGKTFGTDVNLNILP